MADKLTETKRNRFLYLEKVYEETGGNKHAVVDLWNPGVALGFSRAETENIYDYLEGEGLVEAQALGEAIGITHAGIVEVEKALSEPQQPTQHFPANVISIGTMIGGAIQQDVQNSTQTVNFGPQETQSIGDFVAKLKQQLPQVPLEADDHQDVATQVAAIELQLNAPKPNKVIIAESLKTVRSLLEGVAGNLVAAGLLGQLTPLLVMLGLPHH